jgi:hypothetical protein
MKLKDIEQKLGLSVNLENQYFNSLRIAEDHYFRRSTNGDYRELAVERCLEKKVNFSSTCNSFYYIMKKFVKVSCESILSFLSQKHDCKWWRRKWRYNA